MATRCYRVACKDRSGLRNPIEQNRERERQENYKQFYDRAIHDGWEYSGDGRDTIEFFRQHSNFEDLIRDMTPDEIDAFQAWTAGDFMRSSAWGGFANMPEWMKNATRNIDGVLDKATLDTGIVIARQGSAQLLGLNYRVNGLGLIKKLEGRIINSKGFMSWGAAKEGLKIGAYRKNVEFRLSIPGGVKGAGMWIGDDRIHGWGARQREFITNRDANFIVGKSTYDRLRDMYVVELKYAGQSKHDYGRG